MKEDREKEIREALAKVLNAMMNNGCLKDVDCIEDTIVVIRLLKKYAQKKDEN